MSEAGIRAQPRTTGTSGEPPRYDMAQRELRMVSDVVVAWAEMDGENDEQKKLNSLLTDEFILRTDMPANECLSEARAIRAFWRAADGGQWRRQAEEFLLQQFARDDEGRLASKALEAKCRAVVERIDALLHGGPWPDAVAKRRGA